MTVPGPLPRAAAPPDLAALVEAARGGDGTAFTAIHDRFARVVHGIALARVGPQDAADVTQEVFVKVHRGLSGLEDPAAFAAWICTLARNTALDHRRAVVRRPAAAPLTEEPAAPRGQRSDRELREMVLRCLAKLPDAYRETLFLRLAEDLSGPEIAERTGLKPDSVRVNLCRGMAMLRPLLREGGW